MISITITTKEIDKNKYKLQMGAKKDISGKQRRYSRVVYAGNKKDLERQKELFREEVALRLQNPNYNGGMKVSELIDTVLKNGRIHKDLSQTTIRSYMYSYERIKENIGDWEISLLSPVTIQNFIDTLSEEESLYSKKRREHNPKLEARNYSSKTIKETYSVLKVLCSHAVILGFLQDNPCHNIILPSKNQRDIKYLTSETLPVFLSGLKNLNLSDRVLFELALFCGLRRGEACALRTEDVILPNGDISIVKSRNIGIDGKDYEKGPKSKAGIRLVKVPDTIICDVASLVEENKLLKRDYLITDDKGEPIKLHMCNKKVQDYQKKIGIDPPVSFHGLRHTFVSLLTEEGLDAEYISRVTGHADTTITKEVYTHALDQERAANLSAEVLDKFAVNLK